MLIKIVNYHIFYFQKVFFSFGEALSNYLAILYSLLFLAPKKIFLNFFKHVKRYYYPSDNASVCSFLDMVLLFVIPTALTQSGFFPSCVLRLFSGELPRFLQKLSVGRC